MGLNQNSQRNTDDLDFSSTLPDEPGRSLRANESTQPMDTRPAVSGESIRAADATFESATPPETKGSIRSETDAEAVRNGIEEYQHSILDHLRGEVVALKKFAHSRGVSIGSELDEFLELIELGWSKAVERIDRKLKMT